jgi:hypothetical protein
MLRKRAEKAEEEAAALRSAIADLRVQLARVEAAHATCRELRDAAAQAAAAQAGLEELRRAFQAQLNK